MVIIAHKHTAGCITCIVLCLTFHIQYGNCVSDNKPSHTDNNVFLQKLFNKYGNGSVIEYEAFEHLLQSIGLANIHIHDHLLDDHFENGTAFLPLHPDHNHTKVDHSHLEGGHNPGEDHGHHEDGHIHDSHDHSSEDEDKTNDVLNTNRDKRGVQNTSDIAGAQNNIDSKCLSVEAILIENGHHKNTEMTDSVFKDICPSLVQLLDSRVCSAHHSDDHPDQHFDEDKDDNEIEEKKGAFNIPSSVWAYASLSVFIISLAGLLSVAIIPVLGKSKVFYNHMLQFFVALAVGSLIGDACLHLIPHSMSEDGGHSHGDGDSHTHDLTNVWKGLAMFGGIYFFFLTERLMGLYTDWKRRRNQNQRNKKDVNPKEKSACLTKSNDGDIGEKLSHYKDSNARSCETSMMMVHSSKGVKGLADDAHRDVHKDCELDINSAENTHSNEDLDTRHEHHHHGPVPSSVASVAWMVIMGDGLHNFSDGLAIGASFADSLTGGLSTSVAVLCHELPHELGDFAVLLRAGMSAKQAIVYNCVSSVLCFLGMVVGVAIGNITAASSWIFVIIAGMFIYISLVDMLPEMKSVDPKTGENPFLHLVIQNSGILLGMSIMLVIALFEHKITLPALEP